MRNLIYMELGFFFLMVKGKKITASFIFFVRCGCYKNALNKCLLFVLENGSAVFVCFPKMKVYV